MIGLRELRDRTEKGCCPFCGDRIPEPPKGKPGVKLQHCGDDVCRRAYWTFYRRDQRAEQRAEA